MSKRNEHQGHQHNGDASSPPLDPSLTANDEATPPANRSGGPRTSEGKRASSKNALKHGATSSSPVAAGESQEDFDALMEGLRAHFAPVGVFEDRCVYEIGVEFQVLDRIRRQTRDLIDLQARNVDPPRPASLIKSITHDVPWTAFSRPIEALGILKFLGSMSEDYGLTEEVFQDCLLAISKCLTGASMDSVPDRAAEGHRTAGHLRRMVTGAAEVHGVDEPAVINAASALLDDVIDRILGAEWRINKVRSEIAARAERKARAHLPGYDDYDRLMRYKRAAERSLQEWIDRLETSQRARSGDLPPPVRIHGMAS